MIRILQRFPLLTIGRRTNSRARAVLATLRFVGIGVSLVFLGLADSERLPQNGSRISDSANVMQCEQGNFYSKTMSYKYTLS